MGNSMKFRTLLVVLFALAFNTSAFCQEFSKYIGYEYDGVRPGTTLPNGVKLLGGGLIGDVQADPVYGVSEVQKGKIKMIWLEVSTGQDASGVTGWKVLDVIGFSTLARTRYVFFTGDPAIGCRRGGKDIPNVVGEGRIVRARNVFVPSNLWVANLKRKKFERISLAGIRCEYSEP
jgi:hypothetical protein